MSRAIFLVLLLVPSAARADERQDRARSLNNEGNTAYNLGDYAEALDKFTQAYRMYPDARLLFNIGQAHRKLRNYERALDAYRSYLRNSPDASNRASVEEIVAEIEKLLEAQKASDKRPPQGTVAAPPAALPPVVSRITETRPWYANPAGWVFAGSGAAATGFGIGFFVSARSLEDEIPSTPESEKPALQSKIGSHRTIGTILTIVGAAAIVGGVTVFIVSPRSVTREIVPIRDLKLSVGPTWIGLSGKF